MNEKSIKDSDIDKFFYFFNVYNINQFFSFGHIVRKLKIDEKTILKLLLILVEENYLKVVYGFICSNCREMSNQIISLDEVPDHLICEKCKNEISIDESIFDYLILYFKVINDV